MISAPSHYPKVLAGGKFDNTPTLTYGFNVASVTNAATGVYQANFTNPLSTANFVAAINWQTNTNQYVVVVELATTHIKFNVRNRSDNALADFGSGYLHFSCIQAPNW